MVDVDAAFGQEFFDVSVGQPVAQLPAHRDRDHLWRETKPGERGPRYRWDRATAHQATLPDLRSVNATVPAEMVAASAGSGVARCAVHQLVNSLQSER
jgi:hypothetical protein